MGLNMRIHATLRWTAVTAFVLAAAGPATAQSAGGTATGAADAQVGFQRTQKLAPADELAQADAIIAHMDQSSNTVRRQLESARAARDVVKTLCLNDKLSQIDVATRSARDRQAALQAAVQRNDAELADHQFTVLTEHRRRAEQRKSPSWDRPRSPCRWTPTSPTRTRRRSTRTRTRFPSTPPRRACRARAAVEPITLHFPSDGASGRSSIVLR
jgi:hypothetical protein